MESRFNATFSVFSYVNACHWKVWQGLFTTVPGTGAQEFNPFVRKKKAILMWKKLSSAKDAPRDRMAKVAAVGRTHTHTQYSQTPVGASWALTALFKHFYSRMHRSEVQQPRCAQTLLQAHVASDQGCCKMFCVNWDNTNQHCAVFFFVVLILWLWGISSTGLWCIKEGKPRVKSG